MEKQVLIFRHGQTDWNREGRFQGHLDVPINDLGRAQAAELIPILLRHGTQAILSSDLSRAYETARIAGGALGLPVFAHPGLREAQLGEAQGLLLSEIERRFGADLVERWRSIETADADIRYPGGESGQAVIERVFEALEGFLHEKSYLSVAVATHGGVIRRIMAHVRPRGSSRVPIPNGVSYLLKYDLERRSWSCVEAGGARNAY